MESLLLFFPLDSDNLCSQINSINVLIYGKMAEDCAKIIRRGVKKTTKTYYIYILGLGIVFHR